MKNIVKRNDCREHKLGNKRENETEREKEEERRVINNFFKTFRRQGQTW